MAKERAEQKQQGQETSFDENPPVDPSEPQVGNSKARFFVPREDPEDDDQDHEEEQKPQRQ